MTSDIRTILDDTAGRKSAGKVLGSRSENMCISPDWSGVRLAVVDVEGNGRSPPEIVEISIVLMAGLEIEAPRTWLLKPKERITWQAKRVHGISNDDLEGCPSWGEVSDEIERALMGRYLVAHNASVELRSLKPNLPGWKPTGVIDTLKLARRFRPDLPKHGLTPLLTEYRLAELVAKEVPSGPHRAAYDALGTSRLLVELATDQKGRIRPFAEMVTSAGQSGNSGSQGRLF